MCIKKIEHKEGINLKDLCTFVEHCKDLPENTIILLDYSDLHSSTCREIQGDSDGIVFYNW